MFRAATLLRRLAARLALVAMGLNAGWPLLSLANPVNGLQSIEICSSSGVRLAPSPADDGAPQLAPAQCPLCSSGPGLAWVPPALDGFVAPAGGAVLLPRAHWAPHHPLTQTLAQPRGPPQEA